MQEQQAVSSPRAVKPVAKSNQAVPTAMSLKKSNVHRLRPKKKDIVRDVDTMTDAELEALIYDEGGFDYDED